MADILELSLVKMHIRSQRDDEDDYLQHLIHAALDRFETFTGQVLIPANATPDEYEVPMTMDVCHGLLLLIGHWYENREMTVDKPLSEMPEATTRLWQPYVIFHLGDVQHVG